MTAKRQPSILTFFLSLGAALLLMAVSVIGTMVYGTTVQNRIQERFVERASMGDRVLSDLYDMERVFRELGREWSEELNEQYQERCQELDNDLNLLNMYCGAALSTQNYIRRISNFNIYQQEYLKKAMNGEMARYEVYIYIVTGLGLHQQQALEMGQNDTALARAVYEKDSQSIFRRMIFMTTIFGAAAVVMGGMLIHFSMVSKRTLGGLEEYFNRLAASEWDTPDLGQAPYREFTLISQTANRMKEKIRDSIKPAKKKSSRNL